jgi:Cof subfamily protein (haloacid dehalogenase superfamily)
LSFQLLAVDLDGTLLGSNRRVSPRNRAALAAARARGVRLALVTGRRYPAARPLVEPLAFHALALHNGALVLERGAIVRATPLPRAVARAAIELGRALGLAPVLHCGLAGEGRLVVERVDPDNPLLALYLARSGEAVETVADLVAALGEDPVQVMFGGEQAPLEAAAGVLAAELGGRARVERTVYPARGVAIVDVLAPDVSKAAALAFLQERWGITATETLAIGDNWNDREMLEQAGLGLVMGNAEPGLRQLGLPVLPNNDEDGVAVAIERHLLGAR